MSETSKKELNIESEDKALLNVLEYRKRRTNKTKYKADDTLLEQAPLFKSNETTKNKKKGNYRPSRMSDSFMPSAPDLHEAVSKKATFETEEIQLPTHIFNIEDEPYVENERALDEPFLFQKLTKAQEPVETTDLTAGLDQQELMDYMRKNQRVNRVMVSVIVVAIIIVAIIAIIFLVMNLRRAGQSSPLGGV